MAVERSLAMNNLFGRLRPNIWRICCQVMVLGATLNPNPLLSQSFGEALSDYLRGDIDQALDDMRTLAAGGNVQALLFLAEDDQISILGGDATASAVENFERAAQLGSSHAQRRLGDINIQRATETDVPDERQSFLEVARNWYQQAAQQGNAQAALALARLLQNGQGGAADETAALPFFLQAAEAGLPGADLELGLLLIQTNKFEEALSWIQSAAEDGDHHAQALLSKFYLLGLVVEQSDELSLLWLEQAAASGNHTAQRDLAGRYWSGVGVLKDRQQAVSLLQSAAIGGNILAKITLGSMHYVGLGVNLDYGRAREYFESAVESGSIEAHYYLARMVQLAEGGESLGLSQNYLSAIELYLYAAQRNYTPAQEELARLYESGLVRFRDEKQALYWYQMAAEQGSSLAAEAADTMIAQGRGIEQFRDGPVSHFEHLPNVLFITGTFNAGDGLKITTAINRVQPQLVVLHSQGGIVSEAMEVANLIYELGLSTYVPDGAECLSACVYVFSAGSRRIARGDIGVHQLQAAQATSVVPIGDIQAVISQILSAMNRFSVPSFLVERILGSSEMYYLSEEEMFLVSRGWQEGLDGVDESLLASVFAYQFFDIDGVDQRAIQGQHILQILKESLREEANESLGSSLIFSPSVPGLNSSNLTSSDRQELRMAAESSFEDDCGSSNADLRRIFLLSSGRLDYQSFIDNSTDCLSFLEFSSSAIRMLDLGVEYISNGASNASDEEVEGALQLRQDQRFEVQANLQRIGFYAGKNDGIFGAETRQAISDFSEYSMGVATNYISLPMMSHLALMNRVIPHDGGWSLEIYRENPRDSTDNRIVGTIEIDVINGEIVGSRVFNGRGTRLIVNDIGFLYETTLKLDVDGFYLFQTPTRQARLSASVSFPTRQLFGLVSEVNIGNFDNVYTAVLRIRRSSF